jgi:hypothetical protein
VRVNGKYFAEFFKQLKNGHFFEKQQFKTYGRLETHLKYVPGIIRLKWIQNTSIFQASIDPQAAREITTKPKPPVLLRFKSCILYCFQTSPIIQENARLK